MTKARRAELEALGIDELESLCEEAGIDVTRFTKAELIDRLLNPKRVLPAEPEPAAEAEAEPAAEAEAEPAAEAEPEAEAEPAAEAEAEAEPTE